MLRNIPTKCRSNPLDECIRLIGVPHIFSPSIPVEVSIVQVCPEGPCYVTVHESREVEFAGPALKRFELEYGCCESYTSAGSVRYARLSVSRFRGKNCVILYELTCKIRATFSLRACM